LKTRKHLRIEDPFFALLHLFDPARAITIHETIEALLARARMLNKMVVQEPSETKGPKGQSIKKREI
jgi:hypothetical protein